MADGQGRRAAADRWPYGARRRKRYLPDGGLILRLDVEAYGFSREVGAHCLFVVCSGSAPCLDLHASEFLRLIFLPD